MRYGVAPCLYHGANSTCGPNPWSVIWLQVGRGSSGVVVTARLLDTGGNHSAWLDRTVAAKRANPDAAADKYEADEALLIEARLLAALGHRGILELIGVVADSPPVVVCTRLMAGGDLESFLRASRPTCPAPRCAVTFGDVVTMAEQLAAGCKFLEAQKLVHRDLKARNVLVGDSPGDVVLADLGAARSLLTSREYSSASSVSPARWMAPESMLEAKFSHKSDVWSFGVLLWEITALGARPWKEISERDIYPELQAGNRLPEQQFTP